MEGILRANLALVAGCLWPVAGFAQGVLPAETFAWDAPEKMDYVTGYRLQWGPQAFADTPIHQTTYTVENFPTGWNLPVSVYSLGATTNSTPTTINVYNLVVYLEETEDFTNWNVIKSVQITGERKPRSFLRVRLDTQ